MHRKTASALAITGLPDWDAPESPGLREVLRYLHNAPQAAGAHWHLDSPEGDDDDALPLDTELAAALIQEHLRSWLADRGWQVQLTIRTGRQRWRLVDILSITDGGGDRLDEDYPHGEDELSILCESVVVVARS